MLRLADFDQSGRLSYIYLPLTHFRGLCDSDFRNEMNKVAPHHSTLLHTYGGSVESVYDLVEKIGHNCDDKIR